jgi:putative salt-induced outer membrane protein YdiY
VYHPINILLGNDEEALLFGSMIKHSCLLLFTLATAFAATVPTTDATDSSRQWTCQADIDIGGRSGSTHSSGLSLGFNFQGKTKADEILGNILYARESSGGDVSADDLGLKLAYETSVVNGHFWYARTHTGYEKAKGIDFFSVNSLGIGYRLITLEKGHLDGLVGFAHRIENYSAPGQASLSAPSIDFGIIFSNDVKWAVIDTSLTLVPTIKDLSDYIVKHETTFNVLKIGGPVSLKIGMSNEYRSIAQPTMQKLDTTYFVRLSYEWK